MAGVGQSELTSTSATGSKPAEKARAHFQKRDLTPRKRNRPQTHSDGLLELVHHCCGFLVEVSDAAEDLQT
jgi:hypothetical protein